MGNAYDTFAVAVKYDGLIVGHCPRTIFSICAIFIRDRGSITWQVNGSRCYSHDLQQGDLEIPYMLTFRTSDKAESDKTERVIKRALSKEYDIEFTYTEILYMV